MENASSQAGTVEVTKPRKATVGAIVLNYAFGILLGLPVLLSLLAITLIKLSILTILIPLAALTLTAYFLPFGLGNLAVTKLVRSLDVNAARDECRFIVQMTLSPRIRSGLRAFIEDADDFGYLSFTGSELVFEGDSVRLRVPWKQITEIRPKNIGMRGRYLYGARIRIAVAGMPNVEAVTFAERSSLLLATSKRISEKMRERICAGKDTARNAEEARVI